MGGHSARWLCRRPPEAHGASFLAPCRGRRFRVTGVDTCWRGRRFHLSRTAQRSCPPMPAVRTSPLVCPPALLATAALATRSRPNSPGCGVAAGGACRVTGQGHRVLGLLRHPVVPPWCHPRPPSAGQEQPCWLGCRLPGSSGRGAACPCPATGVAAVAATRTTPPARGPGLSGPGGHGRVTAGQTEGVGCCLRRPNGQLFAGACGRDRNCPSAGPAGGREERAVGVSSGRVWTRSRFCLLKE